MSFTQAISTCLSKYVDFQGRAVRSEYWWWTLFYVLISIVGNVCTRIGGLFFDLIGIACGLLSLAILLPTIAVGVRRLHDLDKSGWWLFLGLIPLVGGIILLVWNCTPGTRGPNRFGGGGDGFSRAGPMPMPVGYN